MNHFEEYIAEWYDTIPEGGGTAASPVSYTHLTLPTNSLV